nr:MAG TPA: hypothetical protein [Caudoviricetes sp.]
MNKVITLIFLEKIVTFSSFSRFDRKRKIHSFFYFEKRKS